MTRHLHEPANALLYKALDLPAEERQRFVADACAGEPELLALVRTLLSRIDELDEFLDSPHQLSAAPRPAPIMDLKPGDAVGSWRIERELGRDGAGLIFLVERHDGGVARAGALKIAQSGASDPLGRFQRERQILSSLNHTGIARVIDSGSSADGRPFFVMEHSEGVAIDQYCADMMLDLPQRVALFAPVCRAVHYAHQQLVIHRDLKPANLRIGQDGAATVLNFGLAGEAGGWAPTALFASPEQLAGQPLGIGSDIYCLGAILYGLLTGRSPNEVEAHGIINVLARPAPARPSDAVTEAAARHYPPLPEFPLDDVLRPDRTLARQLQGDLDRILLKAVALDPAQRYASADEFARDLQRFLDREPVQAARDDSAGAVRPRSLLGVMAAGVVAGALLAGGGLALWKMRGTGPAPAPAEQRVAQPSGQPAAGVLGELDAAIETAPAADRTQLMGAAQPYLGQLAHARRVTGQLEGAHQAATMSLGLAEQLLLSNPGDPRWRRQLSVARGQLGGILIEQARTAQGLAELRKALVIRQEIASADAGNEQAARDVADAHATIGAALRATMDNAAAEQEFKRARGVYAAQLRANPADAALRAGLIELEIGRADVQNLQRHGRDAVQTLAALHALARDSSRTGANAHLAARIALLDAYIQPRGTPAQAFASAGQAVSELVKQSESDPLDTYQLRDSAQAWQRTGEIGLRAGRTEPACRYLGLAAKRYEEFAASKRLNAIDKLRQTQLQALRKDCS